MHNTNSVATENAPRHNYLERWMLKRIGRLAAGLPEVFEDSSNDRLIRGHNRHMLGTRYSSFIQYQQKLPERLPAYDSPDQLTEYIAITYDTALPQPVTDMTYDQHMTMEGELAMRPAMHKNQHYRLRAKDNNVSLFGVMASISQAIKIAKRAGVNS